MQSLEATGWHHCGYVHLLFKIYGRARAYKEVSAESCELRQKDGEKYWKSNIYNNLKPEVRFGEQGLTAHEVRTLFFLKTKTQPFDQISRVQPAHV